MCRILILKPEEFSLGISESLLFPDVDVWFQYNQLFTCVTHVAVFLSYCVVSLVIGSSGFFSSLKPINPDRNSKCMTPLLLIQSLSFIYHDKSKLILVFTPARGNNNKHFYSARLKDPTSRGVQVDGVSGCTLDICLLCNRRRYHGSSTNIYSFQGRDTMSARDRNSRNHKTGRQARTEG